MSGGAPVAVSVRDVSKSFRRPHHRVSTLKERALHPFRRIGHDAFTALDGVSFEVARGEFFGIVGPNGSGKSTLLKCLAGIYRPNAGELTVEGRMSPFLELGVGFNPDLDAYDNVVVNSTLLGLSPREARRRFDSIVAFAELEQFVDVKLKNYSSGMQVRLAFAVAIQVDADVLLIDEVLAVGDAAFQQKCMNEFHRIKREGRTVLFVTHGMGAVQQFCDRAMLLDRGKVAMIEAPGRVSVAYHELCFEGAAQHHTWGAGTEERSGTGEAEVRDGWFEDASGNRVTVLHQGERYRFVTEVAFHRPMRNPGVGFKVFDANRRPVLVVDSQFQTPDGGWLSEPLGEVATGTGLKVGFGFENLLAMGSYTVTSNVHPEGGPPVADERGHFRGFEVTAHLPTTAVVDLPMEVTVER